MSNYDTPEQVEARRSVFAKFNRLRMIQEEKNKAKEPKGKIVTADDLHDNPWAADMISEAWRQQQLQYTRPYLEEYRDQQNSSRDQRQKEGGDEESKENDDNCSTITSSSRPNALISRLANLRGRGRKITTRSVDIASTLSEKERPSVRSPVPTSATHDFEMTSTIMPPTEVQSDQDINSNISSAQLRNQYFSGYRSNNSLPIYENRNHIINSINSYSVVIIEGSTGCGKTTQVPLYILEDAIFERSSVRAPVIYVTQPRRIAARSIAERVCHEHNWALGSLVGYQVGLEKVAGPDTILIYCTAGVLLQKIIQERSLKHYTHIIIDEAHERDADTDLLLMMIRKLMLTESPVFRLIIMSATMDIEKLRNYYTFRTNYGHQAVTTPSFVKIGNNKSPNDVQVVYSDKFNHLFNIDEPMPDIDLDNPEPIDSCFKTAVKIIVDVIPHLDNYTEASRSTLVFLPGLAEISKLDRMIRSVPGTEDHLDIIPLHSCLAATDQLRVFKPSKPGCRKVILATNIAESSITVTDIGFIIDFCLTKVLMKDNITRFPMLKLLWSTQDKCTQRAGRTGRCCPGKVFRMVPFSIYRQFAEYAEPELLVAPLELSVLRVKNFNMGEIQGLFAVVLDPPPFGEIRTAVLELKQIGALSATCNGKLSDIDGDITPLGKVISSLPIDVHLSKLIVVAQVFDVLEDAIIVAACLSTNRTVVKHLYQDPLESYDRKLDWANGSYSDLFVSLDVYYEFKECKSVKGKSDHWLATWCSKRALDDRKLHDVDALVQEIKTRLEYLNINIVDQPNRERKPNEDHLMLKIAFCAAFYPNYFLTDKLDADKVSKELCGMDPTCTVSMHNIPVNQVPLYKTRIETPIREMVCPDFDLIADTSRAFLVFRDSSEMAKDLSVAQAIGVDGIIEPTRGIPRSVYRALKFGENLDLWVREYKNGAAAERMEFYNEYRSSIQQQFGNKLAPSMMKLVDGGDFDNSRLLNATEEQYYKLVNGPDFYIEVPFNKEQDIGDRKALIELEHKEKMQSDEVYGDDVIFKSTSHRVRGPNSPIRMMFRSVLVKSRGYSVEIDPNSINSVLLDPDYEKDRRQMLVAATVAQNKRNRVLARDTTLMPNIRGLPTLMALIFAQYYRLVYNNKLKCIAGAVFGIGWHENDQPLDRLYEVDLGFDVHITQDDIQLINKARKRISELLKNEVQNVGKPRAIIQQQLRDIILVLMRKRRYPLQELDISTVDYPADDGEQEIFTKDKHNLPQNLTANLSDKSQQDMQPFLPLMENTRLYKEMDLYESVRKNLIQLENIFHGEEKIPQGGIKCLLCGNGVRCYLIMYHSIVAHMDSQRHLDLLKEFEIFEARAKARAQSDGQEAID